MQKHGAVIIKNGTPQANYTFARDIEGSDIKGHGQVIINSKDPKLNFLFAKLEGSDKKAHERVVLESKDPYWSYQFAKEIDGADIEAHKKLILESKDKMLIDEMEYYLYSRQTMFNSLNNTLSKIEDNDEMTRKIVK